MTRKYPPDSLRVRAPAGLMAALKDLLRPGTFPVSPGVRIAALSRLFLETPYRDQPLGGGPDRPEPHQADFHGVDCFTFLDIVEALRRCRSWDELGATLVRVRYRDGRMAWENRNHFFSDWLRSNAAWISDVTAMVGGDATRPRRIVLNRKADGSAWVPGIPTREAVVRGIPTRELQADVLQRIRTGDYIGVSAEAEGLDVTHVGIFIRERRKLFLRHASSVHRKVLDEPFVDYLIGKPGILVYRPIRPEAAR